MARSDTRYRVRVVEPGREDHVRRERKTHERTGKDAERVLLRAYRRGQPCRIIIEQSTPAGWVEIGPH